MITVFRCQVLRIWKWCATSILALWILGGVLSYTAIVQYGVIDCWFSIFHNLQIMLPLAAIIPLAAWMNPFLSERSAEVLHTLPNLKRYILPSTVMFLLILWLIIIFLPIMSLWLCTTVFPLGMAMARFSVQVVFMQIGFLACATALHSALNGLYAILLVDGFFLLAMEIPATSGTFLRTVNAFEEYSYGCIPPLSWVKTASMLLLSVVGAVLFLNRFSYTPPK